MLKTSLDITAAPPAPEPATKTPEQEALEIAIGVQLTEDELGSRELRRARAASLFPNGEFGKVAVALRYFDMTAASVDAASPTSSEAKALADRAAALNREQAEICQQAEALYAKQDRRTALVSAVSAIRSDIKEEEHRLIELGECERTWRGHYFALAVGRRDPLVNEFSFFANMRNARLLAEFTAQEVLPELKRRLATAEADLAAFEKK